MTILAPFNSRRFNTGGWNGETLSEQAAGTLKIVYNQREIELNWSSVSSALYYHIQVSLFADFRSVFQDQYVTASEFAFTDLEVNDQKRYWRWHPSIDGATKLEPWSEVGSYWLDTTLGYEVELNRNEWAFIDPEDSSDVYELDLFPQYTVINRNMYRIQERNRLGEMLSEFLTVKEIIELSFDGEQYIDHQQLNEIRRFHNDVRTFFLATFKDGERARPMPHVWKVEFTNDPAFSMIAAGRQDLLRGTLTLEEV